MIAATRRWLEVAVIGLGLCPFAAAVHARGQICTRVSPAVDAAALQRDLAAELRWLAATDPAVTETTLLVHPAALLHFDDYNRFLGRADRTIARLGLRGTIQLASFHPAYRFAGSAADDIENFTNRSPHPMLQLLRERSVERTLACFPDPRSIYRDNIDRLRALGHAGWERLWRDDDAPDGGAAYR